MSEQSHTIRVSRATHERLRDLASRSNATITATVDEAILDLERKRFWAEFNIACEARRADPEAWDNLQQEDSAWNATLADGLTPERNENEPSHRPDEPGPG